MIIHETCLPLQNIKFRLVFAFSQEFAKSLRNLLDKTLGFIL